MPASDGRHAFFVCFHLSYLENQREHRCSVQQKNRQAYFSLTVLFV